ncbi:MAG: lipo-like protein [Proteobacteria bacterium]|nr:lipo-like protein [Pseudomonadota bacterium]
MPGIRERIGRRLARYLAAPVDRVRNPSTSIPTLVAATLRKGDVLLVDGNSRFSVAIRYLTQSTWSHAALCVDDLCGASGAASPQLLEADVTRGVQVVPLDKYAQVHTRICRPVGLTPAEIDAVVAFARAQMGHQYDMKNVFDLMRYMVRTPPLPDRIKRRALALGSGDPTRAICSSLIAQAYQSVHYPILPQIVLDDEDDTSHKRRELLSIRHHSLFAPRDFDVSPYFRIVKPTIESGFDPHKVAWAMGQDEQMDETAAVDAAAARQENAPDSPPPSGHAP